MVEEGDVPTQLIHVEGAGTGRRDSIAVGAGPAPVFAVSGGATHAILIMAGEDVARFCPDPDPGPTGGAEASSKRGNRPIAWVEG